MPTPPLSARLAELVSLVPPGARLADVACDHALVAIACALSGRAIRAIATDLRPEPIEGARRAAADRGASGLVEFRVAPGLAGLKPDEADTAVIAGIGAPLIERILTDRDPASLGLRTIIAQSPRDASRLRALAAARDWDVETERLLLERGHVYHTLVLRTDRPSRGAPPEEGPLPVSLDDAPRDAIAAYLAHLALHAERAAAGLARARRPDPSAIRAWRARAASYRAEAAARGVALPSECGPHS